MKSKEEIEQLADKSTMGVLPSHLDYRFIEVYKQFYIDGYNQCQEDMADKKYTKEDLIDVVIFGMQKGLNVGKVEETDNDWVNSYIKSLNKQD